MAGAVMRTTDFPELLDTPLRKIFFMAYKNVPPEYIDWVHVVDTDRAFEDDLRMAEFGQVPRHVEGSAVIFEEAVEGETRRYVPEEFQLGYSITKRMMEDDQHGKMAQMTRGLRKSFRHLFEVQAYSIINRAQLTTTSKDTGFDGLSLASTVHPNLKDNSVTQANTPAAGADLSNTAVQQAVRTIHGWDDENGLPAFFTPALALVSGDDQYVAANVFRNAMLAGTANNDENWVRKGPDENGISRYIASRYITDVDSWAILCRRDEHDLNLFVRIQPQFETGSDFVTGNFLAKGRARLVYGHGDWRGVYFSPGA